MPRHFYRDHVYPFLVKGLGNPEPIRKIRERLIPLARGTVLEIGVGSGANFIHYRPEQVSKLYALEPNPGMIQLAKEQQHGLELNIEYLDLPGERIPLDDRTVDTIVSTFTLCTIDAVQDAIREIRRVLRPSGRLIFIELGRSPDPSVRHWQNLLQPVVHRMYAGLDITRDMPQLITRGGLTMERMEKGYLAKFPKALTYCYWGTFTPAIPASIDRDSSPTASWRSNEHGKRIMDSKKVFSMKAEKYAKYRWEYAAGAIETIISVTRMSINSTVADIGAGTGKLTKHFVTKAQKIYAVEPNLELRQILTRELGGFPSISAIDGSAEATTLPDQCVDVVTVAQAIHWFDPEPARQEIMRILKDDGWLVLIRNDGIDNEQNEAVRSLMTEEYGANMSVKSAVAERTKEMPASFYFANDDFKTYIFPFALQQGWQEFLGTLTTVSFMPDEDHPLFPRLETEAKKIFSRYSSHGYWKVEGETKLVIGRPSKLAGNAG